MPDLVICFIPNEPALHAAFGADPELFDYALERNVLLVSPTSLIGLLRTMELGWRQERMVAEAAEIAEAAKHPARPLRQIPRRLRQGRQAAAHRRPSAYDTAVGSMERRLLPQLRKVEGLGVAPGKEIEAPHAGRGDGAGDHRAGAPRQGRLTRRIPASSLACVQSTRRSVRPWSAWSGGLVVGFCAPRETTRGGASFGR